jgi:hypothetical protein
MRTENGEPQMHAEIAEADSDESGAENAEY